MRSSDSHTEDISVDHNRVARDYALMRLEYIKLSTGNHLDSCLKQITEDFTTAQERLLSSLDPKNSEEEKKISQVFDKVLKEAKLVIAGKSKKIVPAVRPKKSSPVTKLRRRTSIEATENVSSPATPTKKKGGRLAAKPLLDNIDENAPISSPKPTRRWSVAQDDPVEEKPLTPARRSTRIRSNTSLTAETPQGFESPRARRISRRNSLAGSDNEAIITTPVKQTRRTRKASTSSVENAGEPIHVIVEEADDKKSSEGALSNNENLSPNNVRKSARLMSKPRKSFAESPAIVKPKKTNTKSSSPKNVTSGSESLKNGETSMSSEKPDLNGLKDKAEKLNSAEKENSTNENLSTSVESESQSSTNKSNTNIFIVDKYSKFNADVNDSVKTNSNTINNVSTIPPTQNISVNDTKDVTDSVDCTQPDPLAEMIVEKDTNLVECTVFIEDTSSNTGSIDKEKYDDQCVPVLQNETLSQIPPLTSADMNIFQVKNRSTSTSTVLACEPMDIDETMPDNISLTDHLNEIETSALENNNSIKNKGKLSLSQAKNTSQLEKTQDQPESVISVENKKSDTSVFSSSMEKKNNKNKRKSLLSQSLTTSISEKEMTTAEPSLDKSKRSSISQSTSLIVASAEKDENKSVTKAEESVNISNRKSLPEVETNKRKSKNKSLTQSLQDLEKSTNENKSTLILSQIKDDETSITKSPKVTKVSQPNEKETSIKEKESSKLKNISNIESSENTPLKDKALKTLGMQTSTPVISNDIAKKVKPKKYVVENPQKSKTIDKRKQSVSDKSSEESESDESDFMDNEAEDAGDDYESGDSRDDEEIKYAEENKIVERGETLDSDDEASNDTDYEKDSFVVSSDAEDYELLDGSGDDLNLSDNELTMSAKSKKKYNERKSKEQKKSSREMFESRHKIKSLYESSSSSEDEESKAKKKNNRMRLDSSALGSEDGPVKSVKSKRMRINSTLDDSCNNTNANVSLNKKKGLPNSSTDVINENEITAICDESMLKKKDPLKVDVKLEPKTPQKDLDLSTVNFSTHLPISEIQVSENVSMVDTNETSDPLQEDDDESLCSENQEIMNNYDSMLNDLNKSKQHKSFDGTKKSKKAEKTIVDELNLTCTKTKEKSASKKEQKLEMSNGFDDDESSSNSIDLKLLFPDDESDSEDEGPADFIPLKKFEAMSDIRTATSVGGNSQMMSLDPDEIDGQDNFEETLETNQNNTASDKNASLPMQSKTDSGNNKKLENSTSSVHENSAEMLQSNEINISLSKTKKKENLIEFLDTEPKEGAEEIQNSYEKGKTKKNKTSLSYNSEQSDLNVTEHKDVSKQDITESTESQETSLSKKKKKLKKHLVTETDTKNESLENEHKDEWEQNTETTEAHNTSLSKKNKKSLLTETDINHKDLANEHKDEWEQNIETTEAQNTNLSKKNKKNKKNLHTETDINDEDLEVLQETPLKDGEIEHNDNKDTTESNNTSSSKKKKKKHSISLNESKVTSFTKIENRNDLVTKPEMLETELQALLTTLPTDGGSIEYKEINNSINGDVVTGKKRKRMSSGAAAEAIEGTSNTDSFSAAGGKKKKIKLGNDNTPKTDENISPENQNNISDSSTQKKKKKKNKDKKTPQSEDVVNVADNAIKSKKSKKRKERDDDEENNQAKLFKESHQNNIHVPRLPTSLLQKLEVNCKPNRAPINKKVVSTTNFEVEEGKKRKNKPSYYLEESVYLDSETPDKKKNIGKINKPKVLPFVPTASTSSYGFTSNFKVNVIPTETKFIAQSSNISNFKNDYLYGKNIKRMGTYELYKRQRTLKLSKF